MIQIKQEKKVYIVTVDMGYGHQRAVYPLRDMGFSPATWSNGSIITANTYPGIPKIDQNKWERSRQLYEAISRIKKIPIIGQKVFHFMDYLQRIEPFYPRRDLSHPSAQLKQIYRMIYKGWGKDLIDVLNRNPLPLITSFFIPAFFAEVHKYKGDIYCICTDTDVSRAWASLNPSKSRIQYLVPNKRVKQRLELYGVKSDYIFVTGFPLPKENIGGHSLTILKEALGRRIKNLDPKHLYQRKYKTTLDKYLGMSYCNRKVEYPLTITFAVGGAGAQRDIGVTILESLHKEIDAGKIILNLVAGARNDVYRFYFDRVKKLHLEKHHGGSINIIYANQKMEYFRLFNNILLTTDILWTKPSELSFYAALGIPIIMAPSVGSQEDFNRKWLHAIGAGFEQEDPRYTNEWLFDWLQSGWLAEAAMQGFLDAPCMGAYHIEDIVLHGKKSEIEDIHLI